MIDNSKPGETPANPLPPNTPDTPYYVRTPIRIDIVNASSLVLDAWLAEVRPAQDAHGNALVTIPTLPGESIPDGEGASNAAAGNTLYGSGTEDDPYTTSGTLYATAPVTFAIVGITSEALRLEAQEHGILAAS